jgi:hypothetical protein
MLRREHRSLVLACVVAIGCAGQRESRPTRSTHEQRCVVRITDHGTFVDGEPMSRADVVVFCKHASGGAVLVTEYQNAALEAERDATLAMLDHEGIRVYVQQPICYELGRDGCRPRAGATPVHPRREIVPAGPIQPKREIVGH